MKKILADPNILKLERFEQIGSVVCVPGREWTNDLVRDFDILLVRSVTHVDADLLKNSRVSFVGTATSGFDHIDRDYLQQNRIHFCYCPGCNATSVAEYILSAVLALSNRDQKIETMTAGIIGCGHVGSEVEKLLRAIGVTCILNDPPLQKQMEKHLAHDLTTQQRYRSLDEALSADIVTIHTPLTFDGENATHKLISERELDQLKPDVIFINAARGGVVDENALQKRIEKTPEMMTVIDCWQDEPNIDRALLDRVSLGTPHIAGYSYDGKVRATRMLFDAVTEFYDIELTWSEGQSHQHVDFAGDQKSLEISSILDIRQNSTTQISLRERVLSHYDIRADSAALKKIVGLDNTQASQAFDQLRKNYPKRREFKY
ncbi:MAG: 4-phosphoerythronate dehydrogenase [Gammaproteobacteria bacterium]